MKIIFTKREVEQIILGHVHREFYEEVNQVKFCDYSEDEFVTVSWSDETEEEDGDE
jgi:UDP-2,3-diacylglucosamine pyrophosphatase LpxH